MIASTTTLLGLVAAASQMDVAFGFSSSIQAPMIGRLSTTTTALHVLERDIHADDSAEYATPLQLTTKDLERLKSLQETSTTTMPILILDSLLPGQELTIDSSDPKMARLVHYCLENNCDIGMLGLNPTTGAPLSRGVTVQVKEKNVRISPATHSVLLTVTGEQRMQIQSQPWLDDSGSFYFSNVELLDARKEPTLSDEQQSIVQQLSDTVPGAIQAWSRAALESGVTDHETLEQVLKSLGPLPSEEKATERAFWIAAALNPLPSLNVCLEIRPAMLSCTTDYERMLLACQALQSSTDHLLGTRRLF